jgi:hypothetical protein
MAYPLLFVKSFWLEAHDGPGLKVKHNITAGVKAIDLTRG